MNTDIKAVVAELERLERAASPAPWEIHDGGRFGSYGDTGPSICQEIKETGCQPLMEAAGPANPRVCEANFQVVCKTRNALPALLAELRRLWAIEDAAVSLREAHEEPEDSGDTWGSWFALARFFAVLDAKPTVGEQAERGGEAGR